MMSKLEVLLGRLLKVRGRKNAWTACCPAHADKNPSLAIRLTDDGRILLHCFGGCSTQEVLDAVGLTLTDLFPDHVVENRSGKPVKPAFYAADLMRIIHFEALIVLITASDIEKGRMPSEDTRNRVRLAYERIDEAVRYANAG